MGFTSQRCAFWVAALALAGSQNDTVYSLEAKSGCIIWTFTAKGAVGASISVAKRQGSEANAAYGPYFSDQKGFAHAVDAATGAVAWHATPGGLHAVKLATGERVWFTPPPAPVCGTPGRGCNRAQSAAITAIPGIVFSPSNDGAVRAFSSKDGAIVWTFDANHEVQTLNGVKARGGSMNGPAPVVAGGLLYVSSGYGAFGSRTGNVLLAFGVESPTAHLERDQ